jgi:hypothetical protein
MGWLFSTVDTTTELMYFVPVLAGAFYVGRAGTLWLNGPIEVADGRGGTERAIHGDGRLKALVQPRCDVRMPGMELNSSNGPYGYLAVLNFIIFFVAFVFIGIELVRHEKFVRIKAETARAQADAAHAALHGGGVPATAKRRAVKR